MPGEILPFFRNESYSAMSVNTFVSYTPIAKLRLPGTLSDGFRTARWPSLRMAGPPRPPSHRPSETYSGQADGRRAGPPCRPSQYCFIAKNQHDQSTSGALAKASLSPKAGSVSLFILFDSSENLFDPLLADLLFDPFNNSRLGLFAESRYLFR